MMMGNKTELAATVCATILRLAHELAREWICLQAAVAFLTHRVGYGSNPARRVADV